MQWFVANKSLGCARGSNLAVGAGAALYRQDVNKMISIRVLKRLALGFVYWGLLVKCSQQQLSR
jgi:hypothetical protein